MASVSKTSSSLGNTSLRGFGGLVSGLDRDELIEQMSSGTQTKIQNQKDEITKLEWKQEAYQAITDQILDLEDTYLSFSGTSPVSDSSLYAKNIVTVNGDSDFTKYVTASGSSDLMNYVSLTSVDSLATSATVISGTKATAAIEMDFSQPLYTSNLKGRKLTFEITNSTDGKVTKSSEFEFPTSYRDKNGNTVQIDYTTDNLQDLVNQLNAAITSEDIRIDSENDLTIQFKVVTKDGKETIDYDFKKVKNDGTLIDSNGGSWSKPTLEAFSNYRNESSSAADYLKDQEFTVAYGSESKTVKLLTTEQVNTLTDKTDLTEIAQAIQSNLDTAFGENKMKVMVSEDGTKLLFNTVNGEQGSNETSNSTVASLTITSSDHDIMTQTGLSENNSTKITASSSIWNNRTKLGFSEDMTEDELNEKLANLEINGVKIDGVTKETTIDDLVKKINAADAGVKATFLTTSNRLMLVATESGSGRTIKLGKEDSAAATIFGGISNDGKDAKITISYGGSISETLTSSTNTFNIDGLKLTVSGEFKADNPSQGLTFSAKANVDNAVEKVKAFIEAYNAMVTEVHTQITTKPDKSYGPLTDDQKDEMSETSIENWEKKAKQGLLYNNSTMRDLSMDLESVLNTILKKGNGISYSDLEEIGITMSEDMYDGGTLAFDEAKFRSAMESNPEKVSDIMTGGNNVNKGLTTAISETLTKYATRYSYKNGGSYGRLVEEAGSSKISLSVQNNQIYKQLKSMKEILDNLKTKLSTEQDRYIKLFTTMETAINNMNSQSNALLSLTG